MYNERNEGLSVRDIFIQLLFIILFVFILVWLFPTKASVDSKFDALAAKIDGLSVLTNGIFEDNMATMKEAAINYYTDVRMPKNINDVKSMTLGEMLKQKLLVEFKDANNKTCDTTNSYVEVKKLEDEYQMKINLECSDNEAYIIVHLGCYNYCESGVCEKTTATTTNVVNKPVIVPVVTKSYQFEYEQITNAQWGTWSGWSNWSTNGVTQTDYRRVEIDTREEVTGSKQVKTGTDVVTVNATANTTTYCATGYSKSGNYCVRTSNQTVAATCPSGYTLSGSSCVKSTSGTTTVAATCPAGYIKYDATRCSKTTGTTTYTKGTYVGTYQYNSARATYDSTYYYDFVSSDYVYSCDSACTFKWVYTYKVYKKIPNTTNSTVYAAPTCPSGYSLNGFTCSTGTSGTTTASLVCPGGYTLNGTTCTSSSTTSTTSLLSTTTYSCNSGYTLSGSTCYKVIDLYTTQNTYQYVTYYRFQTRAFIDGTRKVEWSSSKYDTRLINQGYVLTGKSREA